MSSVQRGWGRRVRGARARADRIAGRKRSIYFTNEENGILVDMAIQHYDWILGAAAKKGQKSKMWSRITDAVNAVGGYDRTVDGVKKRYFDIKRQVRRKIVKARLASAISSDGAGEEADLSEYEKALLDFLGPIAFQKVEAVIVDTDALAAKAVKSVIHSSGCNSGPMDPGDEDTPVPKPVPTPSCIATPRFHAPPQSPSTPEPDAVPEPLLMKRLFSLVSDVISLIEEDFQSPHHQPEAGMSPQSTTSSSSNEENMLMLAESDPSDTEAPVLGAAPESALSTLENFKSQLRGIAEQIRQHTMKPTRAATEREQENLHQRLQHDRLVSLIVEMNEKLERTQELMRQSIEETRIFNSQFLETIQIIGAGLLGSSAERVFPSWRVRHPHQEDRSKDD